MENVTDIEQGWHGNGLIQVYTETTVPLNNSGISIIYWKKFEDSGKRNALKKVNCNTFAEQIVGNYDGIVKVAKTVKQRINATKSRLKRHLKTSNDNEIDYIIIQR